MRVTCGTWRVWAVRTACAVAALLAASGPLHAFYWYDWPGSGLSVQASLLPQTQASSTSPQPPGGPSQPGPPVQVPPVGPPSGPTAAPEPATGLLGLVGLGVCAAARRWRKR